MEEDQELQNPFPSPPSHYTNYTSHNLQLLSLLKARLDEQEESSTGPDADLIKIQHELLANEKDIPDWPLTQLEKPRVDWILEEGEYNVFGDTWFTKERIPTLAEMGGTQLYPEDLTVDRRPALKAILRTFLQAYSCFLSSTLVPPPPQMTDIPPDWQRLVEWMRVMGQNIMGAANDLRPVQARCNLEAMLTRQLELRREETKAIHEKCDSLESKLAELRRRAEVVSVSREDFQSTRSSADAMDISALFDEPSEPPESSVFADQLDETLSSEVDDRRVITLQNVTQDDVLCWAEETG